MFNSKKCLSIIVAVLFSATLIPVYASSSFEILSSEKNFVSPRIWDNYVTWTEVDGDVKTLKARDRTSKEEFTVDSGAGVSIAGSAKYVSGDNICWVNNNNVFVMNATERKKIQLTNDENWPPVLLKDGRILVKDLAIEGDKVIFSAMNVDKHTAGCFISDTKTHKLKTIHELKRFRYNINMAVHNGKVIFESTKNSKEEIDYDVKIYDIESGKKRSISYDSMQQTNPVFQGDNVVYYSTIKNDELGHKPATAGKSVIKIYNLKSKKTMTLKGSKQYTVIENPNANFLIIKVSEVGNGMIYKYIGFNAEKRKMFNITDMLPLTDIISKNSACGDYVPISSLKNPSKFAGVLKLGSDFNVVLFNAHTQKKVIISDEKEDEKFPVISCGVLCWQVFYEDLNKKYVKAVLLE